MCRIIYPRFDNWLICRLLWVARDSQEQCHLPVKSNPEYRNSVPNSCSKGHFSLRYKTGRNIFYSLKTILHIKLTLNPMVVNCFQTLYLWPTDNNSLLPSMLITAVVNCFQTLYLWPTDNNLLIRWPMTSSVVNCFQTLYLWPTDNNSIHRPRHEPTVVNCFQTLYLWPTDNNIAVGPLSLGRLWIAFKLYIFDLLITILMFYYKWS